MIRAKKASSWFQTEFLLSTGYRVDDLDWNIAGDINGNNPNIFSELKWKGQESFQLKIANKTVFNQLFLLRGSLSYGRIIMRKQTGALEPILHTPKALRMKPMAMASFFQHPHNA
ncbi:MAG: hypothetical protein JRD05_06795 [Deltaproteobacteria bacterium]|nr:hypothetical protein [Deltaproteobacteria bacterium]